MKKNLTSILIGLSLLAVPAAFADFVIDGNSSTTGYGYGYGNCSTDGNGGFMTPCTGTGYSYGYGYGANGLFYPGSSVYGTTGTGSTGGASFVSNSYVGSTITNNNLGLPQTTGATNTTVTNTVKPTTKPAVKTVKKTKRGSLPATGSDSTMYVLAAFAVIAAVAFVAVKRNKNA
jgi:LPXTG-motif cell wall-anchored protein